MCACVCACVGVGVGVCVVRSYYKAISKKKKIRIFEKKRVLTVYLRSYGNSSNQNFLNIPCMFWFAAHLGRKSCHI